jgi:5-methylcytosine-specific restriction endonuclease McrA
MPRRIRRRSDDRRIVGRNVLDDRRPPTSELGYDAAWQRVAKHRRRADCHLCQVCLSAGRQTAANDVDRIIPIHVRPDWRLELANTQVICRPHHRMKTGEDARRYGSSTAQRLTAVQLAARSAALLLKQAPRAAPPGGIGQTWACSATNRVPPDVRAAAKLGAGGVT